MSSAGQLDDQLLDKSTIENTQVKVKDIKDRWGVVTQRLEDFCNRDIPVSASWITCDILLDLQKMRIVSLKNLKVFELKIFASDIFSLY